MVHSATRRWNLLRLPIVIINGSATGMPKYVSLGVSRCGMLLTSAAACVNIIPWTDEWGRPAK